MHIFVLALKVALLKVNLLATPGNTVCQLIAAEKSKSQQIINILKIVNSDIRIVIFVL